MSHPYHSRASIEADIPEEFLLDALDDDRDGTEDEGLYEELAATASDSVDAYLAARVSVPLGSPPAIARQASRVFCLESLYSRRGWSKDTDPPNPWASRADDWRARLARIAAGEEPLAVDTSGPSIDVVSEPARTTSAGGRMGY